MGSVDGVRIALIITATKITYFHNFSILAPVIIPNTPKITCTIGIWNAIAVVISNTKIKSKYCVKDHNGSSTSELYKIKNWTAAGIKQKYENPRLINTKIVDINNIGKINFFSSSVKPGFIKKLTCVKNMGPVSIIPV